MCRTSVVHGIKLHNVSSGSTFVVGDTAKARLLSKAIAVRRQYAVFFRNEGEFEDYPLFSRPIPLPVIDEQVSMATVNLSPFVKVNNVRVMSVTASSAFLVGCAGNLYQEARIKQFRQFVLTPGQPPPVIPGRPPIPAQG